jgi:hypothetical protein
MRNYTNLNNLYNFHVISHCVNLGCHNDVTQENLGCWFITFSVSNLACLIPFALWLLRPNGSRGRNSCRILDEWAIGNWRWLCNESGDELPCSHGTGLRNLYHTEMHSVGTQRPECGELKVRTVHRRRNLRVNLGITSLSGRPCSIKRFYCVG